MMLLALLVAAVTRTFALGRWPGINGDEAWYGVNVQELLAGGAAFFHTGVGNPLNPLHSGLLLILSTVFGSSLALLRVPEVILGLAAVALAYPLLRGPLGGRTAAAVSLLLAVSPTAVAYSRLGWDPSGTPFLAIVGIGCALHNRPLLALASLAFAYLIHPTNIFLAPMVGAAWLPHATKHYALMDDKARRQARIVGLLVLVVAIPSALIVLAKAAGNPDTPLPSMRVAFHRVVSPSEWFARLSGILGLLSGTTAIRDITRPLSPAVIVSANAAIGSLMVVAFTIGWPRTRASKVSVAVLAGCLASFATLHVIAFPNALEPGFERYGLSLLVPLTIAAAVCCDAAARAHPRRATAMLPAMAGIMTMLLAGGYFYPLAVTGGGAAATYRTGAREPKAAVFDFLAADSGNEPVKIVADDWFLYWTLRYLAKPQTRFQVEPAPTVPIPGGTRPRGAAMPTYRDPVRTYYVSFAGVSPPPPFAGTAAVFAALDPLQRPIVTVYASAGR